MLHCACDIRGELNTIQPSIGRVNAHQAHVHVAFGAGFALPSSQKRRMAPCHAVWTWSSASWAPYVPVPRLCMRFPRGSLVRSTTPAVLGRKQVRQPITAQLASVAQKKLEAVLRRWVISKSTRKVPTWVSHHARGMTERVRLAGEAVPTHCDGFYFRGGKTARGRRRIERTDQGKGRLG